MYDAFLYHLMWIKCVYLSSVTFFTFIYEGYPESRFGWAIKKKQEYITNFAYSHMMYIPYTTFRHSFHHC